MDRPYRDSPKLTHRDESDSLIRMKRLQVLLEDDELRAIQEVARKRRMTTAEWVRQQLRAGREAEGRSDTARKLAAIRKAVSHWPPAPAPSIDQMNAEIARGYLDEHAEE
jgi:hypothetical protein